MSAAFGNMGGGTGNMIGSKLLSLFNSPPSMTQALLGQYYDPDELRKRKLGGAIMGIGQGLLSAQAGPGLTDAGVIGSAGLGMGQGLQNAEQEYIREAVGGYELSKQQEREKREEDERLAEQAKEADAQAQFEAFIETSGLDEPQKNFLRANPQAASKIMADRYFPQQMDPLKEMQIKKMQYEMDNPNGRDAPSGYRWTQEGNQTFVPGGPADPAMRQKQAGATIPAEIGARIGLGEEFLQKDVPTIRPMIEAGEATGPIDFATGMMGRGNSGEVQRRMMTGVDALRRNLTGAGMGMSEASEYVNRYQPSWKDDADTLKKKLEGLERDLRAVAGGAIAGRSGNIQSVMDGNQAAPQQNSGLPTEAVQELTADPSPQAIAEFNSVFGQGAAESVLNGQ